MNNFYKISLQIFPKNLWYHIHKSKSEIFSLIYKLSTVSLYKNYHKPLQNQNIYCAVYDFWDTRRDLNKCFTIKYWNSFNIFETIKYWNFVCLARNTEKLELPFKTSLISTKCDIFYYKILKLGKTYNFRLKIQYYRKRLYVWVKFIWHVVKKIQTY